MELEKTKFKVERLLNAIEETRDNDELLIANVWTEDLINRGFNTSISVKILFFMLRNGELTSTESIRRVRQKLQEKNEHLRGYKYNKRMEHQKVVKEELKTL
jgi:hypothetical protein